MAFGACVAAGATARGDGDATGGAAAGRAGAGVSRGGAAAGCFAANGAGGAAFGGVVVAGGVAGGGAVADEAAGDGPAARAADGNAVADAEGADDSAGVGGDGACRLAAAAVEGGLPVATPDGASNRSSTDADAGAAEEPSAGIGPERPAHQPMAKVKTMPPATTAACRTKRDRTGRTAGGSGGQAEGV